MYLCLTADIEDECDGESRATATAHTVEDVHSELVYTHYYKHACNNVRFCRLGSLEIAAKVYKTITSTCFTITLALLCKRLMCALYKKNPL